MAVPGDTSIGGAGRAFPSTLWTVLMAASDPRSPAYRDALETLSRQYWKPVYAYFRAARPIANETAKDMTQDFFADLFEGDLLSRYSKERGSFRSYLRGALHLFVLERHRRDSAQKRGGDRRTLALDDGQLNLVDGLVSATASPEEAFDRHWSNAVLDLALDDLREELDRSDRGVHYRLFERYQIDPPPGESVSHARLAQEFGIDETKVNHYLATCRELLRRHVVARIRDYVTDEAEVAEEIHRLFMGLG